MENKEDIRFHNSWKDKEGNILYLESTKGYYDTSRWGRENHFQDRKFSIRINEGERFPFSHESLLALIESILNNDAKPVAFIRNCENYLHRIHEIKGKRKKLERIHYNIPLENFTNRKLWNCGGKDESS